MIKISKCYVAIIFTAVLLVGADSYAFEKKQPLAEQLGWVNMPNAKSICKGQYLQPNLAALHQPTLPMNLAITQINADQSTLSQNGVSVLTGNVVVIQSGRKLLADKAVLYRNPQNNQIQTIDLYGHVRLYTDGRLILGDKAHLRLTDETGYIDQVTYRMLLADDRMVANYLSPLNETTQIINGEVAWGQAARLDIQDKAHNYLVHPSYTTCQPNTRQWRLVASKIRINREKNIGTARNVRLEIGKVPVFYWPYLNFPTSRERKTGFLFPLIRFSSRSGAEFTWPLYLNLAPNYDAIFAPTAYSKRGVLVKGNFRYLFPYSAGQIDLGVIPDDRAFTHFQKDALTDFANQPELTDLENASSTRKFIHWQNQAQFDSHWSSNIDYSHTSDDYYFEDFGGIPEIISTNQLLQQSDVNYKSDHWDFTGMLQNYQTLHQVDRVPVSNLYSRLPEFDLASDYNNLAGGLDFFSRNQLVYFTRATNPGETTNPIVGTRSILDPGISRPVYWPFGFLIPSVDLQLTDYQLQNQLIGLPKDRVRTIPTFDIDSGLYVDRDLQINTTPYTQTLEPRIFYLYVPFHDQSEIPLFESGTIPFTYDQLFRTNRFSGADRMGDANQISLALTSRFINQNTGDEKIKFSIGQIYYFENRRVTLCSTPGCSDFDQGQPGVAPEDEPSSPIAAQLSYYFNRHWSLNGDVAWDPHLSETNNANVYFQYRPSEQFLINFGYNFLAHGNIVQQPINSSENNLNQASVSVASPITEQWSLVGAMNYNISQNHPQTYLLGVQYDSCCWAVRLAGGRAFTSLDENGHSQFSDTVYFQFLLKGLANIDPDNLGTLFTGQVPGYKDPFIQNSRFV